MHPTAVEILQAIIEYEDENDNWHPTIREVMEKVGKNSTSHISYWVERLAQVGMVEMRHYRSAVRSSAHGRAYLREQFH